MRWCLVKTLPEYRYYETLHFAHADNTVKYSRDWSVIICPSYTTFFQLILPEHIEIRHKHRISGHVKTSVPHPHLAKHFEASCLVSLVGGVPLAGSLLSKALSSGLLWSPKGSVTTNRRGRWLPSTAALVLVGGHFRCHWGRKIDLGHFAGPEPPGGDSRASIGRGDTLKFPTYVFSKSDCRIIGSVLIRLFSAVQRRKEVPWPKELVKKGGSCVRTKL